MARMYNVLSVTVVSDADEQYTPECTVSDFTLCECMQEFNDRT